jgi:hypothetical protein
MAYLAIFVIFCVDVITCQNFNLPHIYHIDHNLDKGHNQKDQTLLQKWGAIY